MNNKLTFSRKVYRRSWSLLMLVVSCSAVNAAPITWGFEGVVTLVTDHTAGTFWTDAGVQVGDTFSGKMTFEPDTSFTTTQSAITIPGYSGNTTEIRAPITPGLVTFTDIIYNTTGGDFVYDPAFNLKLDLLRLSVNEDLEDIGPETNGIIYDTFAPTVLDVVPGSPTERLQVFRLVDQAEDELFTTAGFPTELPILADLIYGRYYAQELDSTGVLQGVDTRLTQLYSVPAPQTIVLFLVGLIALVSRKRQASQ